MTPLSALSPKDKGFYERPARELARRLPGEIVQSQAGRHIITVAEAFSGLIRKGMEADYARKKPREPGDICVTNFRGWPQLNVVGYAASGKPQLTWLQEMETGGGTVGKNAGLVKQIAEAQRQKLRSTPEIFEYAVDEIDGKNVQDARSPLRILENTDLPLKERRIAFIRSSGEGAGNSVGTGVLTRELHPVTDKEQLEAILAEVARDLRVDPEKLRRDPQTMLMALKKSAKFRRLIEQLANGGEGEAEASEE